MAGRGVLIAGVVAAGLALVIALAAASIAHAGADIVTSVKEKGGSYSDAIEVDIDKGEKQVFPLRALNVTDELRAATLEEFQGNQEERR